jgi:hypothetical protein
MQIDFQGVESWAARFQTLKEAERECSIVAKAEFLQLRSRSLEVCKHDVARDLKAIAQFETMESWRELL